MLHTVCCLATLEIEGSVNHVVYSVWELVLHTVCCLTKLAVERSVNHVVYSVLELQCYIRSVDWPHWRWREAVWQRSLPWLSLASPRLSSRKSRSATWETCSGGRPLSPLNPVLRYQSGGWVERGVVPLRLSPHPPPPPPPPPRPPLSLSLPDPLQPTPEMK